MASEPNQEPLIRRAYLTKQELTALSGLSAATIQRYKENGKIPFFQPGGKGGRVLFPLDAIEVARRELPTDPSGLNATAHTASQTPAKLSGPRPRWQTHPLPK